MLLLIRKYYKIYLLEINYLVSRLAAHKQPKAPQQATPEGEEGRKSPESRQAVHNYHNLNHLISIYFLKQVHSISDTKKDNFHFFSCSIHGPTEVYDPSFWATFHFLALVLNLHEVNFLPYFCFKFPLHVLGLFFNFSFLRGWDFCSSLNVPAFIFKYLFTNYFSTPSIYYDHYHYKSISTEIPGILAPKIFSPISLTPHGPLALRTF